MVRLREGTAGLIQEAPLSEDQAIVDEGEGIHLVTATVTDTAALRRWLLGLGARAAVLEPASLREYCQNELQAALRGYTTA